ncbi:hypothetical protein ABT390_22320 [Streptomyces aurantiacus]|uniref:Uncharacterized protein n=1 Tax=Streptomyces aurantiacus JA 4570 TaxID=1286094 RepID=S4A3A4_9ACTN|nr:hypothetical protein [Streptomyces aurantiacus]EPH45185.1 hypothetical protein STRAU_1813 [Streptomyces aurantiacus JA 4570]
MHSARKALIGVGAAALLATGGVSTAAAQSATGAHATSAASAAAQDSRAMAPVKGKVTAKKKGIGKASATFKWKGQNRTGPFKLYVNDTSCDGWDAFTFLQFKIKKHGELKVRTGDSRLYDYTCRQGGGERKTVKGYTTSYKLHSIRIAVCQNDRLGTGDTCHFGKWKKNPKY